MRSVPDMFSVDAWNQARTSYLPHSWL